MYQAEKFKQTELLNNLYGDRFISAYDNKCAACVIKDHIKHITFYFATLYNSEDEILIRAFCSDQCLDKYLKWRNPNHFLSQVLNSNISDEDFFFKRIK